MTKAIYLIVQFLLAYRVSLYVIEPVPVQEMLTNVLLLSLAMFFAAKIYQMRKEYESKD